MESAYTSVVILPVKSQSSTDFSLGYDVRRDSYRFTRYTWLTVILGRYSEILDFHNVEQDGQEDHNGYQ